MQTAKTDSLLFSPFQIKSMHLKNRVVMSPMGSNLALCSGEISDEHIEYYRLRAAGGVGLIIVENMCVDFPAGSNGTTQLRLDQDCFIPRLYRFNEVIHRYGCCTSVQLNHAGCTAVPERIGCPAVSASRVPLKDGSYSEELSVSEIHRIARQFGRAAARAKCAGFDSVEIHAGHGYLIDQFLSPLRNHRTDEFGGSLENRARFCCLVTAAVRAAVGPDFPVLIRLSLEEFIQGGNSLEDSLQLLKFFHQDVDLIDASVGTKYAMDAAQLPDGWRTYLAKAVKDRYHQPCAVMGNIRLPEDAEGILSRGEADLIVIGRGLLADPQWAAKARQGRSDEIRPCISCNVGCVNHRMVQNRPIRCTVNPSITCEPWTSTHRVTRPCTVVVVGGGMAGLEAACTAAESGCRVFLLEREAELGGWVRRISVLPQKFRMKRLLDYMLRRAQGLQNLTCLTGVCVTAEQIRDYHPDLVIWSVGSIPSLPNIAGLHAQLQAPGSDLYDLNGFLLNLSQERQWTGKTIGLAGGGPVALDIAEFFAELGNKVTIIEQLSEIGSGLDPLTKGFLMDTLQKHGATILTSHRLESVADHAFMAAGPNGARTISFDAGFICLGLRSNSSQAELLQTIQSDGIPTLQIGDSRQARRIYEGIHEGYHIIDWLNENGYYKP